MSARAPASPIQGLSIVGLSDGQQPMANADGTVWISFNGEVFNYVELRNELIAKGRRFRTGSDTEVILQLYDEMGIDCVDRLNGDFAFAIWDEKRQTDDAGARPHGRAPAVPHIAQGRAVLRLRGEGLARRAGHRRGDRSDRARPDLHVVGADRAAHVRSRASANCRRRIA